MVGVAGFEPAASCSQGTRANQAALHPEHAVYKSLAEKWQVPAECEVRILLAGQCSNSTNPLQVNIDLA